MIINEDDHLIIKPFYFKPLKEDLVYISDSGTKNSYFVNSKGQIVKSIKPPLKYIDSIAEIKDKRLDEGEYIDRWRINKPEAYIAPKNIDWDNPNYEKFLFVNYDNFDWINLRKKFWIAFDYWLKVEDIKKHTPQSDLYGTVKTSGEFEDYEED